MITKKLKREFYDKFVRDKDSKRFYDSARWKKAKRMKLNRNPLCELCEQEGVTRPADLVHHLLPVDKNSDRNLDLMYLVSLCHEHHNRVETEREKDETARGN
ncbi:MAG: HNH endonuclease [Thermodesulfobacteriota bacterium]|jgi:5-methylcytosine-specific restriction protein A